MAEFEERRPCFECAGMMDRRHGTLPVAQPKSTAFHQISRAPAGEIGTYYRCLKNGAHTVIVERDAVLPPRLVV
jgi:predicted dithiol-disulfide oxidoreductase (DUF899 family)